MSDLKSKLPDLKELTSMAGKLYNGVKTSVQEIIKDYQEKRQEPAAAPKKDTAKPKKETTETKDDSTDSK